MKILHVTEASLGGLRRHMSDLMRGLRALGVSQSLAFSRERADSGMLALEAWCRANAVDVHELEMTRQLAPLSDAWAVINLSGLIRKTRPDVLHLHSSKAGGVGRLAALAHPSLRVVYTPNGLATHLSRLFGFIERALGHARTDALIAVSESERDELRAIGLVAEDRLFHVDSGIDLEEVRRLAGSTTAPPAMPKSVVFVGRLSAQKDPLFAAEISALVAQAVPDASFVWVGDGELRAALESRLESLGVGDRWRITGWTENPFPLMAQATIGALVSRYESFGYVTLESMALGKPVVATRVAGSADLIKDGETGRLVSIGNAHAFAEAVVTLLRDPTLRNRMGAAAAARAELFSQQHMASATADLYRRLLEERSRRSS
jgi:glycosyltransferase involved in cell wall biosynthesis